MSFTLRPATEADLHPTYQVFQASILDLSQRYGVMAVTDGDDPDVLAKLWETRRPLWEHLARTAENFVVAEAEGEVIGYARAIWRDGARELTEFFVKPAVQSRGVGRALLERVFPRAGAAHRTIIATFDARAQALYLKSGVYSRFPIYYFDRTPEPITVDTDLSFESLTNTPGHLTALDAIDVAILGHRRTADHAWLLTHRGGYLYRRDAQVVGYGYVGERNGPFALLETGDYPAVLAHMENAAALSGHRKTIGIEVPLINQSAVDYLLARGFKMDTFFAFFMSDAPFGRFENYIFTSPPFFV